MTSIHHRAWFALASAFTAAAFVTAPIAHFALVEHGSGQGDGDLVHVADCDLGHEAPLEALTVLTTECPTGHDGDHCWVAALLRSAGVLQARAVTPIRLAAEASVRPPTRIEDRGVSTFLIAPKASPPKPTT